MTRPDPVLQAWLDGDDEAFIRELALISVRNAWRDRDEDDADVHPESLRGQILALYDAYDALPRWFRLLVRFWPHRR